MVMSSQILADDTSVEFDATWIGFGGIHGGLLAASLMRAAGTVFGGEPHAISAHMYGPVAPGSSHIDVIGHRGGRSAGVQASISDRATALVRLARDEPTPRRAPQSRVGAAA
ncbi:MAG: hypothetical protein ICV72_11250, partial [Aldersonia sp.]|nr:hypothetical protein [Aldersonia sp.]